MRISDWSSDVCSSDLAAALIGLSKEALAMAAAYACERIAFGVPIGANQGIAHPLANDAIDADGAGMLLWWTLRAIADGHEEAAARSEEHTSELQSLMRISYAVFCLKTKNKKIYARHR